MIINIIRTIGIRILAAMLNLGVVLIAGHNLGAMNMGLISLFVLSITLISLVSGFVGGTALVYLIPRNEEKPLLAISNIWSILLSTITCFVLYIINAFPHEMLIYVLVAGIIGSLNQNFLSVLLAKEDIKKHNYLSLLQAVLIFCSLSIFSIILNIKTIEAYLFAVLISYSFVFIISLVICLNLYKIKFNISNFSNNVRLLFNYGCLFQLSSTFALLTYRLTYFYTESYLGLIALGILSVGVQISEAVWILPKSIATVQYSKISNLKNIDDAASLTYFLTLIIFLLTLMAIIVLIILPESFYLFVFGKEFVGVKMVIVALSPGIVLSSMNNILSHFFSGTGRVIVNLISSALGFVCVAIVGYILINGGNIKIAASVSCLAYFVTFIVSLFVFLKINRLENLSIKKGVKILVSKK